MNQSIEFQDNEIVRIKHFQTGKYLCSTHYDIEVKGGLFKSGISLGNHLGCTSFQNDQATIWKLVKHKQYHKVIKYGDLIHIMNCLQNQYIRIDKSKKSPITEQALAYLSNEALHPFVVQKRHSDHFNFCKPISEQRIRFYQTDGSLSLHSHKDVDSRLLIKYEAQKEFAQEVTGFREKDDNDFWVIEKVQNQEGSSVVMKSLKTSGPASTLELEIIDGMRVIIRNLWSGWSLHSHKLYYKSSKTQEVTCKEHPRDENDVWIIKRVDKQKDVEVSSGTQIYLKHQATGGYLTGNPSFVTMSMMSVQAACFQEPNQFSKWEVTIADNSMLTVDKPFFLVLKEKSLCLGETGYNSEQATLQMEVGLLKAETASAFWIIEERLQQ